MSSYRNSTHSIHKRTFWTEFFALYQSLPALWNTSSIIYKDREAKMSAYDIMVEKFREIEPDADREDVLRKINIFRTNYRREVARVKMSEKMGMKYKPTLWYFGLLSFLPNSETQRDTNERIRNSNDDEKCIMPKRRLTTPGSAPFIVKRGRPSESQDEEQSYAFDEKEYQDESSDDPPINAVKPFIDGHQSEFYNFSIQRKVRPKTEPTEQNEPDINDLVEEMDGTENAFMVTEEEEGEEFVTGVTEDFIRECEEENKEIWRDEAPARSQKQRIRKVNVGRHRKQAANTEVEASRSKLNSKQSFEDIEILAKSWAIQYAEMPDDQKVYARKAIADVLFDGCTGNLGHDMERQKRRRILKQRKAESCDEGNSNDFERCYILDDEQTLKLKKCR